MELKALTKEILNTFSVKTPEELATAFMNGCLSSDWAMYEKYLEIAPNLSHDYLRAIWQFYCADRANMSQDYTPDSIANLAAHTIGNAKSIYDCCAGCGSLVIWCWTLNPNIEVVCEELDERVIPYLLFNLALRNISGYVINGDALGEKQKLIYRLHKGERFCSVEAIERPIEIQAEAGICNPPYNISWEHSTTGKFDNRFAECGLPPESNANYAFVMNVICKINSKATFILPNGGLSSASDAGIRQYLLDKGWVSAVISLPDSMFESTNIPTCLLVCDKTNTEPVIEMIDARRTCSVEQRERRGELHTSNRVYKKNVNVFTDEHISKMLIAIQKTSDEPGFAKAVFASDIEGAQLMPSRYIDFLTERVKERPLEDIVSDINRITKDKNLMKLTINETIAREVGLLEIFQLMKQSNEITDTMNNDPIYIKLGFCFEKEKYISLTKNKNEIRIENIDKTTISHLLAMFLPVWRQHIYYLNQRENEYLAEMRDWLLPKLMNGEIEVTQKNANKENAA